MYTICYVCENELEKVKVNQYHRDGVKKNVCRNCQKAKQKAIREAKKLLNK